MQVVQAGEVQVVVGEHPKLRAFLGEIELEQHLAAMAQAGYDDVDDFKNLDADSLERSAGSADKTGRA